MTVILQRTVDLVTALLDSLIYIYFFYYLYLGISNAWRWSFLLVRVRPRERRAERFYPLILVSPFFAQAFWLSVILEKVIVFWLISDEKVDVGGVGGNHNASPKFANNLRTKVGRFLRGGGGGDFAFKRF